MFLTWRRSPFAVFVQPPLCDPDAGGGGGGDPIPDDAHPEYDLDDHAGGQGDDPPGQPGAPAGQPPVQDPARQPAGGPGQDPRTPQTYTADQYNQVASGYRTLQGQNQQMAGQLALMQRQIAALTGAQPPADPAAGGQPPLSEADQKAVAAVYRLFPQLKPLLDKAQDLLTLPDAVNGFKSAQEAQQNAIATRTWDAFDTAVKGVFGETVHPFTKQSLDAAFVSWLETDQNAAARYRSGDLTLATEFMRMYQTGVIGPARARAQNPNPAGGLPRRPGAPQPPARVPRGGAGGSPAVPGGQRPAQPVDPTAVHDAAADAYFATRG